MKFKLRLKMPKFPKWLKIMFCIAVAGIAAALFIAIHSNRVIAACSKKTYTEVDKVPVRDVALLLGASKTARSGNPNQYFLNRVETTAKLYHAGKIRHILISGDNSRKDYDEPTDMRDALLERGVPAKAMTLDYAGFRTLDSVARAKAVFVCDRFTVISQQFHIERAIYLAEKHGIDAIGFAAPEPPYKWLVKRNREREKYARIAAWLDVNILKRKPKFYGPQEPLNL
jgi:SanA protein